MSMKLALDLVPIKDMPPEWADGRPCLAEDEYDGWRVVRFEENYGWVYYAEGHSPFSREGGFVRETIKPVNIASLAEDDIG